MSFDDDVKKIEKLVGETFEDMGIDPEDWIEYEDVNEQERMINMFLPIISIESCNKNELVKSISGHCSRVHSLHPPTVGGGQLIINIFMAAAEDKCPDNLSSVTLKTTFKDDHGYVTAHHSVRFNADPEPAVEIDEAV